MDKAPVKSTACNGLRSEFFEELYFNLVKKYEFFLSDSRNYGLTFKELLLIDSTTILYLVIYSMVLGANPRAMEIRKMA